MESEFQRIPDLLKGDGELASAMVDLLGRSSDVDLDYFFEEVDRSHYSLADWASALGTFDKWLAGQDRIERPFRAMVGYIHCCTLTSAYSVAVPSLEVVVDQCLKNYGFDAIKESQI